MKVYCIMYAPGFGERGLVEIHDTWTSAKEAIALKRASGNLYAPWLIVEEWDVETTVDPS